MTETTTPTATLRQRLDAADVLIEEGKRRIRRSLDSREPADGSTGVALIDAARILIEDAQLEVALANTEGEVDGS